MGLGMSEKSIKREAEGYFCILPYAGDGLYLMRTEYEGNIRLEAMCL